MSIDVHHASLLNIQWVQHHVTGHGIVGNGHTVQLQKTRNHLNIRDVWDVSEDGWGLT